MTAAVAAARVPVQSGPPPAETDRGTLDRWQLVRAAQAGDREAFGQLYAHYWPQVYRFVHRRTGQHQLAEDLTADVFVRALRNVQTVTWQGRDFGAWLTVIARNLVADHFKSGRARLEQLGGDDAHRDDRPDLSREGDPAAAVVDHFTNLTLLSAVRQLTPEQAECIRLRFLLGLSVIETAHAMGKQEGAVKALQYRALRTLAGLLPPGIYTPEAHR